MLKKFSTNLKCSKSSINLTLTLLGGQSFRWKKFGANLEVDSKKSNKKLITTTDEYFCGVFSDFYWKLNFNSSETLLNYEVYYKDQDSTTKELKKKDFDNLLIRYLRLDFNLEENYEIWKNCHLHFEETSKKFHAVRVLDQDVFENVISFICSQNNNITRISQMIERFCKVYGEKCEYDDTIIFYTFPKLENIIQCSDKLEENLRADKFGYRAKSIAIAVKQISENGGINWLKGLRNVDYKTAKKELLTICGIGPKVADCICLMSLNHLESVPIDRHIYKVAQIYYDHSLQKIKLSPKYYEKVSDMFRNVYGEYAGWAQAVLFCSMIDVK